MWNTFAGAWRCGGVAAALLAVAVPARGQEPVRLSLGEAVARAAACTAPVALAGLRVDEAEARADEARSALLPDVQLTSSTVNRTFNLDAFGIEMPSAPGVEHEPLAGPFENFDARLHLTQPLFDPASLLRTRAAHEAVGESDAEVRIMAEQAAERAALAYLGAVRAEAKLAAREADAGLAADLLALAEEQLRAGVSPGIDVTRARTQKVAADGQVLMARNAAEQAQLELARAIGEEPGTRFQLARDLAGAARSAGVPLQADSAVALAVSRRPELQRAEALRRTADAAKRAIRAEALPRVDLVADYGASGLHPADAIATRQIGVQVSVPLFDGLRREARLAEQTSAQRESELRASDLRQQIGTEVRAALLKRSSGEQLAQVARERLALAEEELAQARERFTNGVAGNIELINAQASLLQARDALIDAQFTTARAEAALARATGTAAELR